MMHESALFFDFNLNNNILLDIIMLAFKLHSPIYPHNKYSHQVWLYAITLLKWTELRWHFALKNSRKNYFISAVFLCSKLATNRQLHALQYVRHHWSPCSGTIIAPFNSATTRSVYLATHFHETVSCEKKSPTADRSMRRT